MNEYGLKSWFPYFSWKWSNQAAWLRAKHQQWLQLQVIIQFTKSEEKNKIQQLNTVAWTISFCVHWKPMLCIIQEPNDGCVSVACGHPMRHHAGVAPIISIPTAHRGLHHSYDDCGQVYLLVWCSGLTAGQTLPGYLYLTFTSTWGDQCLQLIERQAFEWRRPSLLQQANYELHRVKSGNLYSFD